jgi:hypothetical protein
MPPRRPTWTNSRRSRRSSALIARLISLPGAGRPVERLNEDLKELLGLFHSNGVEYLVVGGHAVAFHGHPRFTEDVDCFVRPTTENGARIVRALHEFGFASLGIVAADFEASDRMIQLGRAPNRSRGQSP